MKKRNFWYVVIVVVVVGSLLSFGGVFNKGNDVGSLMTFVDSAAKNLADNGPKALAEFNDPNGEWIKGDSYIFVYDMTGKTLVLPPQANLVGTSRLATADPKGEKYVETMVDILQFKNYGWNTYQYAKPDNQSVATKLSYFKKVVNAGKEYIVGSGIYLDK